MSKILPWTLLRGVAVILVISYLVRRFANGVIQRDLFVLVILSLLFLQWVDGWIFSDRIQSLRAEMMSALQSQEEALRKEKEELQHKFRLLLLPETEKRWRIELEDFQERPMLTLTFLRKLEPGAVLHLKSCRWLWPHDEPFFEQFHYKHERIDEESLGQFGRTVYGYQRSSEETPWEEFHFLAQDDEASTSDCTGTIKRLP